VNRARASVLVLATGVGMVLAVVGLEAAEVTPASSVATVARFGAAPRPAVAKARPPTVAVQPRRARPDGRLRVDLAGWPVGAVTISVCGGRVRRGSLDCDQRQSVGVFVGPAGIATNTVLMTPPIACPCVVRVSTATNGLVRLAPVELVPLIQPDTPAPG
jgi:hypothetical protein